MPKSTHRSTPLNSRHRSGDLGVVNGIQAEPPGRQAKVIEFPHVQAIEELEAKIESRLRELTDLVDGFGDTAFHLFLTERAAVREAIEELVVKVGALDWIVRVAKRSSGAVRAGLWRDIEAALADVERTAEYVIRATENWAQRETNGRREPVICMHPF